MQAVVAIVIVLVVVVGWLALRYPHYRTEYEQICERRQRYAREGRRPGGPEDPDWDRGWGIR